MTRFGKTVSEAVAGQKMLNNAEQAAVVAAIEGMAQIIATSAPEVVQVIEENVRAEHGTAAWKILAWAAKDVHYKK